MTYLIQLPEYLKSKMVIVSSTGTRAYVVSTKYKNEFGEKRYKLRFIHETSSVKSPTLWTRDELTEAGCMLEIEEN